MEEEEEEEEEEKEMLNLTVQNLVYMHWLER